jgi:hypothetical protein
MSMFHPDFLASTLHPPAVPLALLALCVVTYGLFSPWLGFHWDDHSILVAYNDNFSTMFNFWGADRPANAYFFYWAQTLLGEKPFLWHILTLLFRLFGAIAVWLLLIEFFRGRHLDCAAIASIFLVYPGFRYQSAAVAYSANFLHLGLAVSSILLMVYSIRATSHKILLVASSIFTGFLSMVLNEYHLGYELLRPVAFWYFIGNTTMDYKTRIKKCFIAWLPFGLLLGFYLLYRFLFVSVWRTEVDPQSYFSMIQDDWYSFVAIRISLIFPDLVNNVFLSWLQAFSAGGHRTGSIYGLIGLPIGAIVGIFWYLYIRTERVQYADSYDALGIQQTQRLLVVGFLLFFFGALPLWFAGISASVFDAHGRFTLSVMLGSSVILFSILKLVLSQGRLLNIVLSLFIGLGVAIQIEAQNDFRRSWKQSTDFFSQLKQRVPVLEKGTLLIVDANVPSWDSTSIPPQDLGIPLNALYAEGKVSPDFQYWAIPIGEVDDGRLNILANSPAATPIEVRIRDQRFSGEIGKHLVVTYSPPKCLRVLNPSQSLKLIHSDLIHRVKDSNISLIQPNRDIAGAANQSRAERKRYNWCHYFQLAELANQYRDWKMILQLTDDVITKNLGPADATEWAPFIKGAQELSSSENYPKLFRYIQSRSP